MELGCSCAYASGQSTENSGFAVLEARRDLGKCNVIFRKMGVTALYFPPRSDLMFITHLVIS